MPIEVVESVRFDTLWEHFRDAVSEPTDRPLDTETVVVPASGWQSYISRRLAQERGCWAQFAFMTVGQWLTGAIRDVLGEEESRDRDVETLTWSIAAGLPVLLKDDEDFSAVEDYLFVGDSPDVERLTELSRRIAGLFDQYMMYRPDLIATWDSGKDWPQAKVPSHAPWQRKLWAAIRGQLSLRSVAATAARLSETLQANPAPLSSRLSVWLCGGVPPVVLQCLDAFGRHGNVRLYVLTHALAKDGSTPHPLLTSLGALSRETQTLLAHHKDAPWTFRKSDSREADIEPKTALAELQRDILLSRIPSTPKTVGDTSLRIYSCHSAMREVEILREQIRDALETHPDLEPEDIAVLCPDLETYAPLVHAVFGATTPGQSGHIPYFVAGRSPRQTRPLVQAYFRLLEVIPGRLAASEVLDLLSCAPIGLAASLGEADLETLRNWVAQSGICWASDASHRKAEGLPNNDLNTWQFGLDRLLMGYAMPAGGEQLVADVLALDRAEGLTGELVGRLCRFVEKLTLWRERLRDPRTLTEWREVLCNLAEDLLATRQDELGVQRIRDAADRLADAAGTGKFVEKVGLSIATRELVRLLDQAAAGYPFRLGGVTVCDLASMRSLPFRVIALVGLNDGLFPRMDHPTGFDLMAAEPRQPGDRSLRNEDKHLFLEALLAARDRIILTYQGQNIRDSRSRPASVVVEELLDALTGSGSSEAERHDLRETELIVQCPLQAFSPRHFDGKDKRLGGYETKAAEAAKALRGSHSEPPAFADMPLAEEQDLKDISISDLYLLVTKPWLLYLRGLDVDLTDAADIIADREPLILNKLEEWEIGDQLLAGNLAGLEATNIEHHLRRSGQLPAGGLGQHLLNDIGLRGYQLAQLAMEHGVDPGLPVEPVHLDIEGRTITGTIQGLTANGIRRAVYSKHHVRRHLKVWVDHVLVTASLGLAKNSGLVAWCKEDKTEWAAIQWFSAVDEQTARRYISQLLRLWAAAHRMPLPFFVDLVDSRRTFEKKRKTILSHEERLFMARQEFEYVHGRPPLSREPDIITAFAGRDPFAMRCSDVPGLE
ncbi:MAG: exodeoxyribonuclease V subunit gamma, partial [Planctomycetota bacterium]